MNTWHPQARCGALTRWLGMAAALLLAAAGAHAALDANARTSDHSINTPAAWWVQHNVTAEQVATQLQASNARLTQLEVSAMVNGAPRFTTRMVPNSGAYAAPGGWWWYHGLTATGVTAALNANNARLIDLERYDIGGGIIRYAAVMVSNSGAAARGWTWLVGVSAAQLGAHLASTGHRIVDLDHFVQGSARRYTAVMVANTGADAKAWQYWFDQTPTQVASRVATFQGRIVKLDRQSNGRYNVVLVRNTGGDRSAWWYRHGFRSMTELTHFATQLAARPVDLVTYTTSQGERLFDAAFIDNANADTRRMRDEFGKTFLDASGAPTRGIFQAYLKRAGGAVSVDLNARRRAETASALKALHLLHGMREVQAGRTTLDSDFTFYDYPSDTADKLPKDKCPNPVDEIEENQFRWGWEFGVGLRAMMVSSDNRTTRGVVLRYGMPAINQTAALAGLTSTTLRHDIGCGYLDVASGTIDAAARRNETSAADLARIYEGVWTASLLNDGPNGARTTFLDAMTLNSAQGVDSSDSLYAIILDEATKLGKQHLVQTFSRDVQRWAKGGSYGTAMNVDASTRDLQRVVIRAQAGILRLPVRLLGGLQSGHRTFVYGHLISDVPISCFNCDEETNYANAYRAAAPELFRTEIRRALQTW